MPLRTDAYHHVAGQHTPHATRDRCLHPAGAVAAACGPAAYRRYDVLLPPRVLRLLVEGHEL